MKPPDAVQRDIVQQWIAKATEDMDAAVFLLTQGSRFRGAIGFHSQQAAEKYLKALLVRHQIDFAKTHDIEKLVGMLRPAEPGVADVLVEAKWLTRFGVNIRYPGDVPDILPGDEERAVELAGRVREAVMAVLEPYLP